MRGLTILIMLFSLSVTFGQGIYAPPARTAGTTAMHKDSAAFLAWGDSCLVTRGYVKTDDKSMGLATSGTTANVIGVSNGSTMSLGDSGVAIFVLSHPIFDGTGADFAVFENGFSATFLELAFVEVSSDGINYFRFPAYSDTQDTTQVGSFGSLDATYLHNLAGKYQATYGTPFDLADVPTNALLNKANITHIKIVDVIGNISSAYASYDSQNNKVNDPWPTAFASSGFDLDALGLINLASLAGIDENEKIAISVYPNPVSDYLTIQTNYPIESIQVMDLYGKVVTFNKSRKIDLSRLAAGVYFVKIGIKNQTYVRKVVKK